MKRATPRDPPENNREFPTSASSTTKAVWRTFQRFILCRYLCFYFWIDFFLLSVSYMLKTGLSLMWLQWFEASVGGCDSFTDGCHDKGFLHLDSQKDPCLFIQLHCMHQSFTVVSPDILNGLLTLWTSIVRNQNYYGSQWCPRTAHSSKHFEKN